MNGEITNGEIVETCIHQLISKHVRARPDDEAVASSSGESLTYSALDDAAERVAHQLRAHGAGPERFVVVCFEKCIWTVVAIYAILKAGSAFVLLDPAHPDERLRIIVGKTKAEVAITSAACHQRLASLVRTAVTLDGTTLATSFPHPPGPSPSASSASSTSSSTTLTSNNDEEPPPPPVHPTNLAYAVFTSGSTGEPKGVLVTHLNFFAFYTHCAARLGLHQRTRALQFASYSFDASIMEMVGTLAVGGTVCVVTDAERVDGGALVAAARALRVSWMLMTPTVVVKMLSAEGDEGGVGAIIPTLRTLVCGGEAMAPAVVERWAQTGSVELINAYGPAEATIACVATAPMRAGVDDYANIGRSLVGRGWLVDPDDHGRLVGDDEGRDGGVGVGELLLEGRHVARSYINDDEKTAAAFIARPVWHERLFPHEVGPHAFYKTGDLCQRAPDGSFVYVGRKDRQVKINGQRTELGEIEHAFRQYLGASEHMAVELIKKAGRSTLVGFVTLSGDGNGAEMQERVNVRMAEVQKRAAKVLPGFMIPRVYMAVPELPLMMTGKLDRKQLQALGAARLSAVLPKPVEREASATEAALRAVWSNVLNISQEAIGLRKPFQSFGGDSISAMQIVAQAKSIGLRLSVQQILRLRTIEALAGLAAGNGALMGNEVEQCEEEESEIPFKLSPIQQLFFDISPKGENHYNISQLVRVTEQIKPESLVAALRAVVARHGMLRARFFADRKGRWFQTISDDVEGSLKVEFHNSFDWAQLMPLISESQRSIDIEDGPLLRADLIQTEGEQLLFLCGHHLVTDFVSFRVMLLQVEQMLRSGETALPRAYSFPRWLKQQERHVNSLSKAATQPPYQLPIPDLEFWGLSGETNVWGDVAVEKLAIDRDLLTNMKGEASTADVLLAGVIHGFRVAFPEREMPAFYVEGHGREPWDDSIDLSQTVSWFTTITPVLVASANRDDPMGTLLDTQDARGRFTENGLAWFASRFYGSRERNHDMEISFNYAGAYQQLERAEARFQAMPEFDLLSLDGMSPTLRRFGIIDIWGDARNGEVMLSFVYNRRMKHQNRMAEWMRASKRAIMSIVKQLSAGEGAAKTAASFPLLGVPPSKIAGFVDSARKHIGRDDIEDMYPCTPAQHALMLSRVSGKGRHEAAIILELQSQQHVDTDRIRAAWQSVVNRHPSLRTVIMESSRGDGTFDQVVLSKFEPLVVELAGMSVQEVQALPVVNWVAGRPEHQLTICRLSPTLAVVRLDINHGLMDGLSSQPLRRDLELAYDGLLDSLPRPPWRESVAHALGCAAASEKALGFWMARLAGVPPCRFPPLGDDFSGREEWMTVKVRLQDTRAPLRFCRERALTVADLAKTAWALVVRRYTGSAQPSFGCGNSGRDMDIEGAGDIVGLLAHVSVCLVRVDEEATGEELLRQTQNAALDELPHLGCPLIEIVRALDVVADGLVNTSLSVQKREGVRASGTGRSVAVRELSQMDSYGNGTIGVAFNTISDDALDLALDCCNSLISHAHADNVAATFAHILDQLVREPQLPAARLATLSPRDAKAIRNWNRTHHASWDACIHSVISERAYHHPNRTAVDAWDGCLTYDQLDTHAERLAAHLTRLHVGPETLVPILMEKSLWAIVAMLAVLKAGAAFVPLSPDAPLERQLPDTSPTIALTSPRHQHLFDGRVQQVVVSKHSVENLPFPEQPVESAVVPANAACVIYTSGFTGRPKGIVLEHRQALSSCAGYTTTLGMGPHSRTLQLSAFTSNLSIAEIWGTLTVGGCVCQPSDELRIDHLASQINACRASLIFMTPTSLALLQPSQVPCVEDLVIGGEPLRRDLVVTWAEHVRLANAYAPAEAAVHALMNPSLKQTSEPSCIGRSTCCKTWIVDLADDSRLAAVGAVGELWLEGPAVARGYLGLEKETTEAFVNRPAFLEEGVTSRFYRTGDLVRYEVDGSIRFIGCKDMQAKIRGQPLDLSEVEYQASEILGRTMAVAAEVITSAQKDLLALFVEGSESSAEPKLQSQLPTRLPGYMVPSQIFFIQQLPRFATSNKLNRNELRVLGTALALNAAASLPAKDQPHGHMEVLLQQLWSEVLEIPPLQIGAHDGFLRLGGDSLDAMKLAGAARRRGFTLGVESIMTKLTLSDMAMEMKATDASEHVQIPAFSLLQHGDTLANFRRQLAKETGIAADLIEDAYPCTPLQEGLFTASLRQPGAYTSRWIIDISPQDDIERLQQAWRAVLRAHPTLRTRIVQPPGLGTMQVVVSAEVENTWQYADDVDSYFLRDRAVPMQLGDVLIRFGIVANTKFVLTAHHVIYDSISLPLLAGAVKKAYRGDDIPQAPPYNRFIKWVSNLNANASKSFWASYLEGCLSPSFPPASALAHTLKTSRIAERHIAVQRKHGSSLTMSTFLQTAWGILLARYSEARDVTFGVTQSGRTAPLPHIDEMTGPTITTAPLRVQLGDGARPIIELLQQVQETSTRMIQHQHFGLQAIRRVSAEAKMACEFRTLIELRAPDAGNVINSEGGFDIFRAHRDISHVANFHVHPLVATFSFSDAGIDVEAIYDPEVLTPFQMQNMLGQLDSILHQLVDADSTTKLKEINLVSDDDRALLREWTANHTPVVEECLHSLFEEQVARSPERPAFYTATDTMSYAEVDMYANRVAHQLRLRLPEMQGAFIALCSEKSIWPIVGMLGILKAGHAVVLMDPSQPEERLRKLTQTSGARLALASPSAAAKLSSFIDLVTIDSSTVETWPNSTDQNSASPRSPAFVIFTAGSTGEPKGCVIEHCSLASAVRSSTAALRIDADTRALQLSSYAHSVVLNETMTVLLAGGCVCVVSEKDELVDSINSLDVNWALLTPSSLALLGGPQRVPKLKTLITTGEPLSANSVATWAPALALLQGCDQAEACGISTLTEPLTPDASPCNIGRCIAGRAWVVEPDDHEKLCPVGAVGELLIEGLHIASGYVNAPDATGAAFVARPAWLDALELAGKVLKTGDLVRWCTGGTLEFVGRRDSQVRISGQRVQLGEIEDHLRALLVSKGISGVAVELVSGRLVAFLVLGDSTSETDAQRKLDEAVQGVPENLALRLPHFMLPAAFLPLQRLPLTAARTLDRETLRGIGTGLLARHRQAKFSAKKSLNDMEVKLLALWKATLGPRADMTADSSFVELGGDSLDAMKLVSSARRQGIQLTVADIYKHPRLADMAVIATMIAPENITEKSKTDYRPFSMLRSEGDLDTLLRLHVAPQTKVSPADIVDAAWATHLQTQMVAASQLKERYAVNHLTLDLAGVVDAERLKDACRKVVASYDILRTVFVYYKHRLLQVVVRDPDVEIEDQEVAQTNFADATNDYVLRDRQRPTSIGQQGVRFAVLRGSEATRLVIRFPHAQYDALSLPLILSAIESTYYNRPSTLALSPPPSFPAFLHAVQSLQPAAQRFWQAELAGVTRVATEIVERPHNLPPSAWLPVHPLKSKHTRVLRGPERGRGTRFPFSTVLKAAWAAVLAELSDCCGASSAQLPDQAPDQPFDHSSDDYSSPQPSDQSSNSSNDGPNDDDDGDDTAIVFGEVLTNRSAVPFPRIDEVAGPCITTAPVVVRGLLGGRCALQPAELLRRVDDVACRARPFQSVGFFEHLGGLDRGLGGEKGEMEGRKRPRVLRRFGSMVQHMNKHMVGLLESGGETVDGEGSGGGGGGGGGGFEGRVGWVAEPWDLTDVAVETKVVVGERGAGASGDGGETEARR
ncbi:putative nonribosomal peptide protein [Lasiodiplodia theobromae]|nr:putative nonribosomal peptide protein [Lasiodiplodia theobromae]